MAYVIVKQGSYSSHDLVRKGGSDEEGEEEPKNRAGGLLSTGGCIFYKSHTCMCVVHFHLGVVYMLIEFGSPG